MQLGLQPNRAANLVFRLLLAVVVVVVKIANNVCLQLYYTFIILKLEVMSESVLNVLQC